MKIYLDTETCGFHGMAVLLQYAIEDGEVVLWSPWTEPVVETLKILEMIANNEVIGFNLAFDWFHISKLYTTFVLFQDVKGPDAYPIDHIDLIADLEEKARDGLCLKPKSAFDIMLHARKGPYQSTMDRSDIKIKKVPIALAGPLAKELNKRVQLKEVYFARKKVPSEQWQIFDTKDKDDDFRDVVLKFAPSSALKALSEDALELESDSILLFSDVEVGNKLRPVEVGWAPFAKAIGKPGRWRGAWPDVIKFHISHWSYNDLARKYAKEDVDRYTRPLYKFFGSPEVGDDDSILACMVGSVRWKGFAVDLSGVVDLRSDAFAVSKSAPKDPGACTRWLKEVMDETEQVALTSTKKVLLEEISDWTDHPAAERAAMILKARKAKKEVELYDKLLQAGRFHASFKVIGTLSSRMSGADGLNPQGIKKTKEVRSKFTLAWPGMELCGGDFEGFEVCLADAAYNDPDLRKDLLQGKSLHALFGESLFPEENYESIMATKGTEDDKYSKSKQGVFALLYGGTETTLESRIGIDLEAATKAYQGFIKKYKKVGEERRKVFDSFCSMRQDGGIGTQVVWHEPADYIESLLQFRRYFTLENQICKALYNMAQKPPEAFRNIKMKVVRRDREQTASGATQSALYAAAFAIQAANMRAAANHVIQSTGAQITKMLQRALWDLQPFGVQRWVIQPMNVHDEIDAAVVPSVLDRAEIIVTSFVEKMKEKVPLLKISWNSCLGDWSQK